jgi:fatty acyl-CoA reductase
MLQKYKFFEKWMVMMQVTDAELFCLLRKKHGKGGFELFVDEKIVPLAGDVIFENMGLDAPMLEELAKEVDIIVNGAATTNFYERSAHKLYCFVFMRKTLNH